MPDEILLNEAAYAVWQTVKEHGPIELGEVVKQTGVDQAQVSAAATEAVDNAYFTVEEQHKHELVVSEGASKLYNHGLPELLARDKLKTTGGEMPMSDFAAW